MKSRSLASCSTSEVIPTRLPRLAAHVLVFGCDLTLLPMLENVGPYVERIYIAYSKVPWTYNREARALYTNPTELALIEKSPFRKKIEVIEGTWETEEAQRNACLTRARSAGFDFLLCADADEFYHEDDYSGLLAELVSDQQSDVFIAHYLNFWKRMDTIIVAWDGSTQTGHGVFAVRCREGLDFRKCRSTDSALVRVVDAPCYHLGYVMSDEDMKRKLATWGHTNDFDRDWWFKFKWLGWHLGTRNIHPCYPTLWHRTRLLDGKIPATLSQVQAPENRSIRLGISDRLAEQLYNMRHEWHTRLRSFKKALLRR
jgi:hypothetical protein